MPSKITDEELECLKKYYPIYNWEELFKVFPDKTKHAIGQLAANYGFTNKKKSKSYLEENLINKKFNKLTIRKILPQYGKEKVTYAECDCECGNNGVILRLTSVRTGRTKSCGCLNRTARYEKLRYENDGSLIKNYCVYMHTSPSGKRYIGITKKNPNRRFNNGNGYKQNTIFWKAIKKYGWENIKHEILETNLTHDEACEREQFYISKYDTTNSLFGYNVTFGGDGTSKLSRTLGLFFKNKLVYVFQSKEDCAEHFGYSSSTSLDLYLNIEKYNPYLLKDITHDEYNCFKEKNDEKYILGYLERINEYKEESKNQIYKKIALKNSKPVARYNSDGIYIDSFISLNDAVEKCDSVGRPNNISNAIKNKGLCGGYLWRYDYGDHSNIEPYTYYNGRSVIQINREDNSILNKFLSAKEAERNTGIGSNNIYNCCKGLNKTAGGYIWRYADEVEN